MVVVAVAEVNIASKVGMRTPVFFILNIDIEITGDNVNLVNRLEKLNQQFQWWQEQEPLLVAVSTGVDSMVLLDVLQKVTPRPKLTVLHVNHELRDESIHEAAFLTKYCDEHQIDLIKINWKLADHPTTGVENAGREFRYAFFNQEANRLGIDKILTAHHQNDQAETILMKLTRGGALAELTGIQFDRSFKSHQLIRPFLSTSKQQLRHYATTHQLTWFEDVTNNDLSITRNRYRHQALPWLQQQNPRALDHITDYAAQLERTLSDLEGLMQPIMAQITTKIDDNQWRVSLTELTKSPLAATSSWIRYLLEKMAQVPDVKETQVLAIWQLVVNDNKTTGYIQLTDDWQAVREYDYLKITKMTKQSRSEDKPVSDFMVKLNQWFPIWSGELFGVFETPQSGAQLTYAGQINLKANQLPLWLRLAAKQDKLALKTGHQSLRRLLINQKVARDERPNVQVLVTNDDQVVAVPGVKTAVTIIDSNTHPYYLYHQRKDQ